MIWIKVREKMPARILEWVAGIMMVIVGLYLVIWPTAFERAGLAGFATIAPVGSWVAASLCLGALRVGALVVNGHKPTLSAPVRCFVAILGAGLFGSVAAGYSLATNQHGPPLAMFFALAFTLSDIFNAARSGLDTYQAFGSARQWNGFKF
jgi:hypothetical protein